MYKEDAEAFVKKHDKNKDGKLDLGELSEARVAATKKDTMFCIPNKRRKKSSWRI